VLLIGQVARYLLDLPPSVRHVDHELWLALHKLEQINALAPEFIGPVVVREISVLKIMLGQLNDKPQTNGQ